MSARSNLEGGAGASGDRDAAPATRGVRGFIDRAVVGRVRDHFARADQDLEAAILRAVSAGLERDEVVRLAVFERRRVPRGHDVAEIALLGGLVATAMAVLPDAADIDLPEDPNAPPKGSMHCGLWLTDRRLLALGYRVKAARVDRASGWDGSYGWVAAVCAARVYPLSSLPDVRVKRGLATVALNLGEPAVPAFEVLFFRYQREPIAEAERFAAEIQRLRTERTSAPYR